MTGKLIKLLEINERNYAPKLRTESFVTGQPFYTNSRKPVEWKVGSYRVGPSHFTIATKNAGGPTVRVYTYIADLCTVIKAALGGDQSKIEELQAFMDVTTIYTYEAHRFLEEAIKSVGHAGRFDVAEAKLYQSAFEQFLEQQ